MVQTFRWLHGFLLVKITETLNQETEENLYQMWYKTDGNH